MGLPGRYVRANDGGEFGGTVGHDDGIGIRDSSNVGVVVSSEEGLHVGALEGSGVGMPASKVGDTDDVDAAIVRLTSHFEGRAVGEASGLPDGAPVGNTTVVGFRVG